ncbi:uncharacterized protein LOC124280595 isoform X2 [Haliotis rubra]|uniref:uncharacterized protein LOC124280595 isoform X2 n=1 Tax=Haliotis rubra TaxID=36100 RepID=UPI001EE4F01C|nr:uncharacterized protein LOC124280595 isoform X2 [Haliotis rubra]
MKGTFPEVCSAEPPYTAAICNLWDKAHTSAMASRCKIWGQVVVIGVLCCSFKQAACKVDLPVSESAKVSRDGFKGTGQDDIFTKALSKSSFSGHGAIKERPKGTLDSSAIKSWIAMMEEGTVTRHRRSAVAVGLFRRRFEGRMKAKEAAKRAGNPQRYRGAAVILAAARRQVAIGKRRYLASWERKRKLEHERRISEDDEEDNNAFQEGHRESSGQGEVGDVDDSENSIYNERDRQPKDQNTYQPEKTDPQLGVSTAVPVGGDTRKLAANEVNTTDAHQGVSPAVQQGVHRQVEGNGESEEREREENEKRELAKEKRRLEEERRRRLDEERRRQLDEERRRQLDEERRRQLDEERRRQLDEERRRQLDEERRRQEERTRQLERIGTVQVDVDGRRRAEEIRKQSPGSRGQFEAKRRQLEKQRGQNVEVLRILRLEEEAQRQKLMKEKEDYYDKQRSNENMREHSREVPQGENLERSENNTNTEQSTVSITSPTSPTTERSQSQQRSEYEKLIRSRCTDCKVGNQTFRGHSRFSYEEDCHKYQCICHCDGTHDCPAQYKVKVCDQGMQERDRPVCNSCTVEGEIIEGNDRFELQDGCTLFRDCKCFCNGTSHCSPDQTENTCVSESKTGPEASQVDSKPNQVCQKCVIEGIEHPAESRFQYTRDCITTDCSCSCNGTIECDQSTAVNRCDSAQQTPQPQLEIQVNNQQVKMQTCQQCLVAGRLIDGNSQFNAKVGCYIDTCFCLCNGRYSCIRNWARNICNDDTGFDGGLVDHRGVCRGCFLQGVHYPGNATFKFTTGCTALDCACTCSGTVECYEESAVNICATRPPTVQPLFEVFTTQTVRTPGPRECKKCLINGTLYDGNTQFDLQNRCHTDRCICSCNGNHTCRRYQARGCNETETSPKKDSEPCQECLIQGRRYPGNSTFKTTSQCIAKDCRCSCSGSVECDDRTAVNICQTTSVQPLPTTLQPTPQEASCKTCVVDGMDYAGGSKFKIKRGCKVYPCHCPCDGRWGCRTDAAVDICNKPSSEPTVSQGTCKRCVVQGRKYPGNSQFKLRKGCVSFRCTCACDGSWNCPPEQARNYCPGSTQSTETTTAATLSPTEPLSEKHSETK